MAGPSNSLPTPPAEALKRQQQQFAVDVIGGTFVSTSFSVPPSLGGLTPPTPSLSTPSPAQGSGESASVSPLTFSGAIHHMSFPITPERGKGGGGGGGRKGGGEVDRRGGGGQRRGRVGESGGDWGGGGDASIVMYAHNSCLFLSFYSFCHTHVT